MANAFARTFDAPYNMAKGDFDVERDTARPVFYIEQQEQKGVLVDVEMVRVQSPGENLNVFGGKVTKEHQMRWPQQYAAFKSGETGISGTPLSKWAAVAGNPDFVAQLRVFGFQTVEDLANMNDGSMHLFHGSLTLKLRAQAHLTEQRKLREAEDKEKINAATSNELAILREQIAQLTAAQSAPAKRKPGRPARKAAEDAAA